MTCPFCGIEDSRIGEWHYKRHQVEYLRDIMKELKRLNQSLDIWVPDFLNTIAKKHNLPQPFKPEEKEKPKSKEIENSW